MDFQIASKWDYPRLSLTLSLQSAKKMNVNLNEVLAENDRLFSRLIVLLMIILREF